MRDLYMAQLNGINNDVIDMGLVLGNAIENAILCLKDNDGKPVKAAREIELDIDKMEKNIESQCLNVISQQQPVASDFHFITLPQSPSFCLNVFMWASTVRLSPPKS
mgnify:CR=1 FL=1